MRGLQATVLAAWLNNRGQCQCGFFGKRRLLRSSAVADVVAHCQEFGHTPIGVQSILRLT